MSAANHTTDENFKIVVALCVARVLASIYIYKETSSFRASSAVKMMFSSRKYFQIIFVLHRAFPW